MFSPTFTTKMEDNLRKKMKKMKLFSKPLESLQTLTIDEANGRKREEEEGSRAALQHLGWKMSE